MVWGFKMNNKTANYVAIRNEGDSTLIHHGIKGQKWGVRRYQNPDGSLTAAGKNAYVKKPAII